MSVLCGFRRVRERFGRMFLWLPSPPGAGLSESALYHVVTIAVVLGVSAFWPNQPQAVEPSAFNHNDVVYYSANEYLPPVNTGGRMKRPEKGQPAYAKQPIISVPREADNRSQTIVAPPNLKLDHDVPMPNIVSWPEKTFGSAACGHRAINGGIEGSGNAEFCDRSAAGTQVGPIGATGACASSCGN